MEVVKELVRAGASVDQTLDIGCTPLYIASQHGHVEVVKELVMAAADPEATKVGTRSSSLRVIRVTPASCSSCRSTEPRREVPCLEGSG